MLKDLRFAIRQLRRSPGFTLTAVLTLGLGIGANTAIFSLVDSIMLRPLPFPQQDRLAQIADSDGSLFPKGWLRALGEHSDSFSAISGFGPDAESNVTQTDSADRVFGAQVMTNAFETLGVHPALGNFFSAEEGIAGRDLVVVLSYGYWQERFGRNPQAIGQTVRIDGISRRIIGVMPPGVRFPYADTQFVTPVAFKGGDPIDWWKDFDLHAFGRLKEGVAPAQAQAELRRVRGTLLPLFPWRMPDKWAANLTVVPLLESEIGATRPRLLLLFGAVGLILLIACANVANLMLARASSREREMAVRSALGASAGRIVRQLLLESVVVAMAAGTAGLMAAALSLKGFARLLPADTPRLNDISLHWPVFLFAALASVITGFLFGLVPALKMASPHLQETLRSGTRNVAGGGSNSRLLKPLVMGALVMGQIGLSVIVITAAGLVLHSFYSLSKVDLGFRVDRIVTAEVALDASACREQGRCDAFFAALVEKARGIAGTESVALTDSLPLSGRDDNYTYDAEGRPRDPRQIAFLATERTVTPDYFSTLGIPLLRGRWLTGQDAAGASRTAVIDQSTAERLWPHQDPLGKRIIHVNDEPSPAVMDMNAAAVVVGVVGNTRDTGLAGGYGDEVYLPMTGKQEQPVMYILMRTRASVPAAAAALRTVVDGIDAQAAVTRVRSLNEVVAASVSAPRSLAILLLSFAALALAIGGVGVYSLIAYLVSWRTREIGIRLALGARRWQIATAVMKQSVLLAIGGCAAGLLAAALLARLLRSFLFGIAALDPLTFCAVPAVMLLLALFAAWMPARRAASVDPMETLRSE